RTGSMADLTVDHASKRCRVRRAEKMKLYEDEHRGLAHAVLADEPAGTNIGQPATSRASGVVSRVQQKHDLANRRLRQRLAVLPDLSRKAIERRLQRLTK